MYLRYVGFKARPEYILHELIDMLAEATDKIYKKKGYTPIIVLDNLHNDIIEDRRVNFNKLASLAMAPSAAGRRSQRTLRVCD